MRPRTYIIALAALLLCPAPKAAADVDFLVPGVSLHSVDFTVGTSVSYLIISEAHSIIVHELEGERAVGPDSAPPVAQPPNEIGLALETLGPGPDTEQEIVASAVELVKLRAHGTAPITTSQLAASLRLPAASRAMTT